MARKEARGFPDMLIGVRRVSSDNDRQTTDRQRDAWLDSVRVAGRIGSDGG